MIEVRVLDTDQRYDVVYRHEAITLAQELHRENPGHWVDAIDLDASEVLVILEPISPRMREGLEAKQLRFTYDSI